MESTVPKGMQKTERSMQQVELENVERRLEAAKADVRDLEAQKKSLQKALKGEP